MRIAQRQEPKDCLQKVLILKHEKVVKRKLLLQIILKLKHITIFSYEKQQVFRIQDFAKQ